MLDFYVPRFEIEIDDKKLDPVTSKAILDVKVEERIDEGASSTITIHDDFDLSSQKFKYLDNPIFDLNKKITINIGYGNNQHILFMGTIIRIEPSFFSGETPTLTVEGQDLSFNYLKRKTPAKKFDEKKYSDIAQKIASDAGLRSKVDETEEQVTPIQKNNNDSYFQFLKIIANEAKATFYIDRDTLYFVKSAANKKEILTLELGRDIISFRPTMNTTKLLTEVEVRWTNPDDPEKPFVGVVKAGDEGNIASGTKTGSQVAKEKVGTIKKVITCKTVGSMEHAKAIADAELNKANSTFIEGTGECVGIPQIRPGVMIGLKKIGCKFSGTYQVTGATHTMNDSGYRTQFSVRKTSVNTDCK